MGKCKQDNNIMEKEKETLVSILKKHIRSILKWFLIICVVGGAGRYIQTEVVEAIKVATSKAAVEHEVKCGITVEYAEGDCWYYDNEMLIHYHTKNFKSEPYRVKLIGQPVYKGGAEQQFTIEGWQTIDPDTDWHHIPQLWDNDNWFKWPNKGVPIDQHFMSILMRSDIDIMVVTQRCDEKPDYQRVCTISLNDIDPTKIKSNELDIKSIRSWKEG